MLERLHEIGEEASRSEDDELLATVEETLGAVSAALLTRDPSGLAPLRAKARAYTDEKLKQEQKLLGELAIGRQQRWLTQGRKITPRTPAISHPVRTQGEEAHHLIRVTREALAIASMRSEMSDKVPNTGDTASLDPDPVLKVVLPIVTTEDTSRLDPVLRDRLRRGTLPFIESTEEVAKFVERFIHKALARCAETWRHVPDTSGSRRYRTVHPEARDRACDAIERLLRDKFRRDEWGTPQVAGAVVRAYLRAIGLSAKAVGNVLR
ncbi:MAG: hypothetical protein ACLQVI_19720 [Polyangiaceae bacterium]